MNTDNITTRSVPILVSVSGLVTTVFLKVLVYRFNV